MDTKQSTPFVVMIDDDVDFLTDLSTVLTSRGFRVRTLSSARRAARVVAALMPDAVLLDLDMPDKSGLSVLGDLRARTRTRFTPVILLTAHRSEETAVEGFRRGLDDCIYKPFSASDIDARVRAAVRRSPSSPGFLTTGFGAAQALSDAMKQGGSAFWFEVPNFVHLVRGTGAGTAHFLRNVMISLGARFCDLMAGSGPRLYEPEPGVFVFLSRDTPDNACARLMRRASVAAVHLSAWKGGPDSVLLHDGQRLVESRRPVPLFLQINVRDCAPNYEGLKSAREVAGAHRDFSSLR